MAMGVGGRGLVGQINVTPMIDVLLVLIIIFLMISPSSTGLSALIPQPATHNPPPQPERTVVIQVIEPPAHTGPPLLKINQAPVAWEDLGKALGEIYKSRVEKIAFVRSDRDVQYEYIAAVIDTAHHAGVDRIGLMTDKIENAK